MNYQERQHDLFMQVESLARRGEALNPAPPPEGGYATDNRICLTSVVFPAPEIREAIEREVIGPLKRADPSQYYYLPESLHLTIQNVRVISDPPNFSAADIEKVRHVFRRVAPRHHTFDFEVRGLLELPHSLALRAYSHEDLYFLVSELRDELTQAGIPDDKSYGSADVYFGNITVVRYNTRPNDGFMALIDELKDKPLGAIPVRAITLITTNLACYPAMTRQVESFDLASS